ncbi:MAG: S-layer homology domain-containing protein [Methanobacterium sp.]
MLFVILNFSPSFACAGTGKVDKSGIDLSIYLDRQPDTSVTQDTIIANVKKLFDEANNYLFKATQGQNTFHTINIYVPASGTKGWTAVKDAKQAKNWDPLKKADVIMKDGKGNASATPDGFGSSGKINISAASNYKSLIHEFGHYGYGLGDEYCNYITDKTDGLRYQVFGNTDANGNTIWYKCTSKATFTVNVPNDSALIAPDANGLIKARAGVSGSYRSHYSTSDSASIMWVQHAASIIDFCHSTNHNTAPNNNQNEKHSKKSCWNTMLDNKPFGLQDIKMKKGAVATKPTYVINQIAGAGKSKTALVIDRSGSMASVDKLQLAKSAAKQFVDLINLPQGSASPSEVSIVTFSDYASVVQTMYPISTQADKDHVKAVIDAISVYNMTAIGDGLLAAYNDMTSNSLEGYSASIILLTDGQQNMGSNAGQAAQTIAGAGIPVYSIGLGGDVDDDLLKSISQTTSGQYYFSPTAGEMNSIYRSVRGEIDWTEQVVQSSMVEIPAGQSTEIEIPVDTSMSEVVFSVSSANCNNINLALYGPDGNEITTDMIDTSIHPLSKPEPETTTESETIIKPVTQNEEIGAKETDEITESEKLSKIKEKLALKTDEKPIENSEEVVESPSQVVKVPFSYFTALDDSTTYIQENTYKMFTVQQPAQGTWRMVISNNGSTQSVSVDISGSSDIGLECSVDQAQVDFPQPVKITAQLSKELEPVRNASVNAIIQCPGGSEITIPLQDDGINGDQMPGDGTYTGYFSQYNGNGTYTLKVIADNNNGLAEQGVEFPDLEPGPDGTLSPPESKPITENFYRELVCSPFTLSGYTHGDFVAPGQVDTLLVIQKGQALMWNASGDDMYTDTADHYVLKYAAAPITESDWDNATEITALPSPKEPGETETFNLPKSAVGDYYYALKVVDEAGNESPLSNVAYLGVAPANGNDNDHTNGDHPANHNTIETGGVQLNIPKALEVSSVIPTLTLKGTDLICELAVNFNDELIKGSKFEEISLSSADNQKVPCEVSISDIASRLVIKSTVPLVRNSEYHLLIPIDAVKGKSGKVLSNNYTYTLKSTVAAVVLTDIPGHWAETAIRQLAEKEIMQGYPDKTFKPEQRITRAEFICILAKAFDLKDDGNQTATRFLDDQQIPAWAKASVIKAEKNGIIKGYKVNNGYILAPNDPISRAEMAFILKQCITLKEISSNTGNANGKAFVDALPSWAEQSIKELAAQNILSGYPDGAFHADHVVSRAQAASALFKALNL